MAHAFLCKHIQPGHSGDIIQLGVVRISKKYFQLKQIIICLDMRQDSCYLVLRNQMSCGEVLWLLVTISTIEIQFLNILKTESTGAHVHKFASQVLVLLYMELFIEGKEK